ncbi:hypothetical protein [Nostoc sp. PCC 7107]|uniref:hypothetical protein n=1 Tax=Nostoc sp. PCC 7107 TaxID=317936 RepID=UPI0002F09700|nr:hypothetical protein [Nostoc sp. PCC 7107]
MQELDKQTQQIYTSEFAINSQQTTTKTVNLVKFLAKLTAIAQDWTENNVLGGKV